MNEEQEDTDKCKNRSRFSGSAYGGVFVVLVGIIFLLNSFGYLHGDAWGKLWPFFIIIPGLFMIFR